jgi:hypothetical protein
MISIVDTIYKDFFIRIQQNVLDVFLCGGVSSKSQISTRDKLKKDLETTGNFRVLYPEDLFMDILNLNRSHNLLKLEQMLAQNCDCICIVCESVGSFVELGAFTNNQDTFPKVIALVKTKYKNQQSFVMLGPIKYIQSSNKDNVIFYNSNLTEAKRQLIKSLKNFKLPKIEKGLDTIVGLHYFLLLILYFVRNAEIQTEVDCVKQVMKKNGLSISDSNFDVTFKSAMKLLYKERAVERYSEHEKECYRLTITGLNFCERLISSNRIPDKYHLRDRIRLNVLENAYY